MKTKEKSVFYQVVDRTGTPVNEFIYTNLELAEEHCDNLRHNYKELYGVRNVFLIND